MNSFQSWTSRAIFSGVLGVVVCFYLAYNFAFSCRTSTVEIAPLQYPFLCVDANDTVDTLSRWVGLGLGFAVVTSADFFEYRKGLKFEFWVTISALLVVLIIMPLYALIVSSTGIDTGYHVIVGVAGGGYNVFSDHYYFPAITSSEQFVLTLISTLAGIISGPAIDKAAKNRRVSTGL